MEDNYTDTSIQKIKQCITMLRSITTKKSLDKIIDTYIDERNYCYIIKSLAFSGRVYPNKSMAYEPDYKTIDAIFYYCNGLFYDMYLMLPSSKCIRTNVYKLFSETFRNKHPLFIKLVLELQRIFNISKYNINTYQVIQFDLIPSERLLWFKEYDPS